jgi:uncharacterized membrane protein
LTGLETTLLIAVVILSITAIIGVFFAVKFGLLILNLEDSIEDCLDILDARYDSMSRVLEIPLFHDSPEIRRVVQDMQASRAAILQIANIMTKDGIPQEAIEGGDDT